MPNSRVMITVLYVSASPRGQADLTSLNTEVTRSQRAVRGSPKSGDIRFVTCPTARRSDVHRALAEERPTIVCFAGHASEEGIALEDDDGNGTVMSVEALAGLLAAHADHVKLVILAACNTVIAAIAIAAHIDCVIAMAAKPMDREASLFTPLIFQALAHGRTVASAFESAKHASETSGDPRLLPRQGVKPDDLSLQHWLKQGDQGADKQVVMEANVKMWWEELPFPWWRKEAQDLLDRLIRTYRTFNVTRRLAQKTTIDLGEWDQSGPIRAIWQSLLDVASDQGKVGELVSAILEDPNVQGAHAEIRALTGLGAAPSTPPDTALRGYSVILVDRDRADVWEMIEALKVDLGLDNKTARERANAGTVLHNNLTKKEATNLGERLSDLGALVSIESPRGEAPLRRVVRTKTGFPMVYIPEGASSTAFWLMTYPVTRGLYKHVMDEGGPYRDLERPMEGVTWDQALLFCERLSRKEGITGAPYRLPTEEEWEHAARANDGTRYAGSNHWPDVAWAEGAFTHPVRTKKPNGFGLYDMSGNVWEWTHDAPKTAPNGGDPARYRVARGGSYSSGPAEVEVRSRRVIERGDGAEVGLRVARSVD